MCNKVLIIHLQYFTWSAAAASVWKKGKSTSRILTQSLERKWSLLRRNACCQQQGVFPRCQCSALARGAPLCAPLSKLQPADPAHPSLLQKGTANARAQRLSHGHPTAAAQTQECVGSKILRIYPPKTWKTYVNTLRACQPPYPRVAQSTSRAQTQPLNHQRANSKPWNSQSWCFTCIASQGVCCYPSAED